MMSFDAAWLSWGTLLFLGAFHGLNPGMGWLFAVALGIQENRSAAVWRALLPLAIGHAGAVALAILAGILAGVVMPTNMLRWPIAGVLIALGLRRLLRHRHPRFGGMRIGMGGLTTWSFLVATAHGAGLMVLPVWLGLSSTASAASQNSSLTHAAHVHSAAADLTSGLLATAVHGASYLFVTALIAWVVFTKFGVGLLRTTWINLDAVWAIALLMSGGLILVL
jgi:uncharacterized MAPEG superfamily protein